MQSRDEDDAALRPLFDAEALDVSDLCDSSVCLDAFLPLDYLRRLTSEADGENHRLIIDRPLGSFLDKRNERFICQHFTNLRRLNADMDVPLYPELSHLAPRHRTLLSRGGGDAEHGQLSTILDPEQAAQLTEIEALLLDSFAQGSTLANVFPRLTRLTLSGSKTPIQSLSAVFRNCSAACPVLEMLTLHLDTERTTWLRAENYWVFGHAPGSLKALVLILEDMSLPLPRTASAFHRLVKRHAPTDVQVHIVTPNCLIDDGELPTAPWAPSALPEFAEAYAAADLARPSFTLWPRYMPPPT